MSSAQDVYTLNGWTTLDVTESDGSTTLPIAAIQGVTIEPAFSIEHLYSADSVKAEVSQQFEFLGTVDINYSKFDQNAALVQQWLAGSGGSTANSLTDTNDPQEFSISLTVQSTGGDRDLSTTVTGVAFESMPVFDGSANEFVEWGLSGEFKDMTDMSMVDNTA